VPISFGLAGATGSGKTYSALLVATGMRRVLGGQIHVIDTEAKRAKKYVKDFDFVHVPFVPPHGPLDYLRVFRQCVDHGASVIVVDSMSHEHEGDGGVAELHLEALRELTEQYPNSTEKQHNGTAWKMAKRPRRKMITGITGLEIAVIYTFRAQEKLYPVKLGWCPIGGREIFSELDVLGLLPPNADGRVMWSDEPGKRSGMKAIPKHFRALCVQNVQLTEDFGESLARWSLGGPVTVYEQILDAMESAETLEQLALVAPRVNAAKEKKTINKQELLGLQERYVQRRTFIERGDGFESDADRDAARARDEAFERASSAQPTEAP
jgi:hypothetical protein